MHELHEGYCQDCTQHQELREHQQFELCYWCAADMGNNPKEIRRLQRALDREQMAYALEHPYLIDPTYRSQ